MTKIIGVTGGIGSGKSKVMNYLNDLGYTIYLSDEAGKRIMQNPVIINKVQDIFDENVIENGLLNRKRIGEIVFNNPDKLKQLNQIIHPAVAEDFKTFIANNKDKDFIFYESAILIESNRMDDFDAVVLITAPEEVRIQRVMNRDGISREKVIERMQNQMSDEEKRKFINFEIPNENFEKTKVYVSNLLHFLKK